MRTRPIISGLLAAGLAAVALAFGVRLYMGSPSQNRLSPDERVDIAALRPPLPRPSFLACPPGYCAAPPGLRTPIFPVPWQRLREDWLKMIAAEPRVLPVVRSADGRRLVLIQHSLLFRFPDVVTVEFVALGPERSSVAVFSRSRYGRGDFGVNRARVERWLRLLEQVVPPGATPLPVR
jgi:hypothetical protein